MTMITRDSLTKMIEEGSPEFKMHIIGRALVVLFNNQTVHEQAANQTEEYNLVGFTGADAYSGTLSAKTYLKYGKLKDWQVSKWTKRNKNGVMRIAKYHKQLNIAAEKKAKNSENNA